MALSAYRPSGDALRFFAPFTCLQIQKAGFHHRQLTVCPSSSKSENQQSPKRGLSQFGFPSAFRILRVCVNLKRWESTSRKGAERCQRRKARIKSYPEARCHGD